MDWVKRINSVLDYIEENLDGEIDDKKIAFLFASPQGMFQRIFANITNMTLSEYIRKRRLTQAGADVKNTDEKIIDIAVKYGYNSSVAFSSAFKSFHGITPSNARNSGFKLKSFQRLAFTLILSGKGVENMQYHNIENAEYLLRQIADNRETIPYLRNVSEHNGVKCACDGKRVAVILPEDRDEWDLSDAYFDTGDEHESKMDAGSFFNCRNNRGSLKFTISKEQAAVLLVSCDGARIDFQRKFISLTSEEKDKTYYEAIVYIDVNSMGIITEGTSAKAMAERNEPVIAFRVGLFEEAIKFAMCSDDANIDIYYSGSASGLIIKSGRLYSLVMPVRI